MQEIQVEHILRRLGSSQSGQAWKDFLHGYSAIVLQVIRHFEREPDGVSDCYLFVCDQLRRNAFCRLKQYRVGGATAFSTYLRAVIRNLCIDWHRKEFGRHRVFQSVEKRSPFEQEIFQRVFEQGASIEEAFELLRPGFPNATREQVAECVEQLQAGLSQRQRWLLSVRRSTTTPHAADTDVSNGFVEVVSDGAPNPEALAAEREKQYRLRKALAQLNSGERLLLQLRYEQELTLEQVARVSGLGNAQQADRKIREILDRLRNELG
jgi:RNA polymerase sigma factor (sigma-70 family)